MKKTFRKKEVLQEEEELMKRKSKKEHTSPDRPLSPSFHSAALFVLPVIKKKAVQVLSNLPLLETKGNLARFFDFFFVASFFFDVFFPMRAFWILLCVWR